MRVTSTHKGEKHTMVLERLKKLIAEQMSVDAAGISMDTNFADDLGVDSLDIVELMMALEEEFNLEEVQEEDLAKMDTVGDLVTYLQQQLDL